MRRGLCILNVALLMGCSSKADKPASQKRFLYFTSSFPTGVHWVFDETFKSRNGTPLCKDFSMGQGGLVPATKYDQYMLKNSGDTLKVPLFWPKPDRCDWDLVGLSIDLRGRPILMSQLNIKEKSWKHLRPTRAMPDSLAYLCKPDSGGLQLECNLKGEETDFDFILNDTVEINRIKVEVGLEKQ